MRETRSECRRSSARPRQEDADGRQPFMDFLLLSAQPAVGRLHFDEQYPADRCDEAQIGHAGRDAESLQLGAFGFRSPSAVSRMENQEIRSDRPDQGHDCGVDFRLGGRLRLPLILRTVAVLAARQSIRAGLVHFTVVGPRRFFGLHAAIPPRSDVDVRDSAARPKSISTHFTR